MRSDNIPYRDACLDFKEIRSSKSGSRNKILRKLEPRIRQLYIKYLHSRSTIGDIPRRVWTKDAREALIHCYESPTKNSRKFIKEVENTIRPEPFLCPYCLMRHPKTRDHFLPKDYYPEYSTLALNLVLVCDPCNRKKGNRFTSAPRAVLNPYFDQIPTTPILHATVSITNGAKPKVKFYISENGQQVAADVLEIAKRHFVGFELEGDMAIEGGTLINSFVGELVAHHNIPIDADFLSAALDKRISGYDAYPINNWEQAILEALDECPDFLNYVNNQIAAVPPGFAGPRRRPRRNAFQAAAIELANS